MSDAEDIIMRIIEAHGDNPDHLDSVCIQYDTLRQIIIDEVSQLEAKDETIAKLVEISQAAITDLQKHEIKLTAKLGRGSSTMEANRIAASLATAISEVGDG